MIVVWLAPENRDIDLVVVMTRPRSSGQNSAERGLSRAWNEKKSCVSQVLPKIKL